MVDPELEPLPELVPEEPDVEPVEPVDPEPDPDEPEVEPDDVDDPELEPEDEPPLDEDVSGDVLEEPPQAHAKDARRRRPGKERGERTRSAYPTIGIVPVSTASCADSLPLQRPIATCARQ
jgi:hypothetical protein